ncbi:MAG: phospholipid carrier-dependent glycosyltransferase [Ktedonobacteraceae bacterium]|nr:phospholipid carrier-dependent glycosyltransferase [Ktedonobacteraceae bacterium]
MTLYEPLPEQEKQQQASPKQQGQFQRYVTPMEDQTRQEVQQLPTVQLPVSPVPPVPPTMAHPSQQAPEIEGGNVTLYRAPNFFVLTTNRQGRRVHPLRRPTGFTTNLPKTMPQQGERIASSATHLLPQIAPINPINKGRLTIPLWLETFVVVVGMTISLVAHAFNMFNFPRYELDEGTYMSNAWAILQGLITPYPYGYGHPPLGWMQIAAWVQLSGGFFTFGNAINSGRVLMLFYALGCSLLVYLIVRLLSASRTAGLLALIIFSLSPLSITYQRQVLLDNIGTFWLLLAMYLLVVGNSRLLYIVGAAVSFGIALLSKEIFLLFLPVMIYAIWLHTTKFQRKFALVAFTYIVGAIGSSFILLAVLKGELFPYSWHLPGDTRQHLSLIDTLIGQTQRTQTGGSLATSWHVWVSGDAVLVACSIVTIAFNAVVGWWKRQQLMLALFSLSFWLLLIRGGIVLPFYFIPLIALTAINTAMAVNTIMSWIAKLLRFDVVRVVLVLVVIGAVIPYDLANSSIDFTQHPTSAQQQAIVWIHQHVPHNAFIVINSYLYMDLREPGGTGVGPGATYPLAHVYFNVATDPDLHDKILNGNWDRIDYIVADSEMLNDIEHLGGPFSIIETAREHSVTRAVFSANDQDSKLVITIYQVQHKIAQSTV